MDIFPHTPLLQVGLDSVWLEQLTTVDATAVTTALDAPKIIDTILQLFPDTTSIYVVIGASEMEAVWRREFARQFAGFAQRLNIVWLNEWSFAEMLQRAAHLPRHSAIYYLVLSMDAKGIAQSETHTLAQLHKVANVPIFGVYDSQLGQGIVGGPLMSVPELGQRAADTALHVLHGESPASIRGPPQKPGPPTFDWRELQRWGIPESRLPPGSVVRYRAPSLWRAYRGTVLSAVSVLAVQSLLIVGLLYQRRARQRAESREPAQPGARRRRQLAARRCPR